MALIHMYHNSHYHAVPLLNMARNIFVQFHNYSLYKDFTEVPTKRVSDEKIFAEYMHLYNDQPAIENELTSEWLNDKVLCDTPFVWYEINILPKVLQLELTHIFGRIDKKSSKQHNIAPFKPTVLKNVQQWNPIVMTHFLLFLCHNNETNLQKLDLINHDIHQLMLLILDRTHLSEDEVPSVYNLLSWCFLQMGNRKLMVRNSIFAVKSCTGCDKTLFSHLVIEHILSVVVRQQSDCIIS